MVTLESYQVLNNIPGNRLIQYISRKFFYLSNYKRMQRNARDLQTTTTTIDLMVARVTSL